MATEESGESVVGRFIMLEKASLGTGESRRTEREGARGPAMLDPLSVLQLYVRYALTHDQLPILFFS